MKKHVLIYFVIITVILLAACSSQSPGTTASGTPQAETPVSGQTAAVSIKDFSFSPASLTISAGTTVVWTNNDSAGHTIKSDAFNSDVISKGQTFEFKFDEKGTYEYSCGVHPSMKGEIIVN